MRPTLSTVALALCGLLACPASTLRAQVEDAEARLAAFRKTFKKAKTREHQDDKERALRSIRDIDSAAAADALIAAYARLEREAEPIRSKRRGYLRKNGGSTKLDPLRKQLQPVHTVQDRVIRVLRRLSSDAAVDAMLMQLVRGRNLPLTLKLVLAARLGNPTAKTIEALTAAANKSSSAGGSIALLRALGTLGQRARAAAEWATSKLTDKNVDVRLQAAKTVAQLAWPRSIEALIDRIPHESGEVLEAILDALVILTNKNPGNGASAWRGWLAAEGGPYVNGEVRLGRGKRSLRQPSKKSQQTSGSYFGIEQKGEAILYVFDISMSMRQSMGGGERGGGGQGRGGMRGDPIDPNSRWSRCKQELHSALNKLTKHKTFNLITFANRVQMFAPRMQKATRVNLIRAHKWIDGRTLELETNIYDALDLAFYVAGRGTADRYYQVEVDTIFFLTDGAPTRPNPSPERRLGPDLPAQILSAVKRWNGLGRVVIHSIGMGLRAMGGRGKGRRPGGGQGGMGRRGGGPRGFLEKLAAQNGGKFVDAK